MKKNILTLSVAVLSVVAASAQFTITQADMPTKFNVEYRVNDTLGIGILPGSGGANQVWDFSALKNHFRDTSTYMDPAGTPAVNRFPQANLVLKNLSGTNGPKGYIYLKMASNYASVLGTYQDNPGSPGMKITPVFNPIQKYWLFPATYMSAFKDTQVFNLTYAQPNPSVDSIRVKHRVYENNVIDAYGKAITPTATYANVMRLKQYTIEVDSIEGHIKTGATTYTWQFLQVFRRDTTTTYKWYSDQYKFSIAQLSYKGKAMQLSNASYLTNLATAKGIHTAAESERGVLIFPNPADGELNIPVADNNANTIFIIDMIGRKIALLDVRLNKQVKLNTADYQEGLYFYIVINNTGNTLSQGKFIVARP